MKENENYINKIDSMDYYEMLKLQRFGSSENPIFHEESGKYFSEQLQVKKNMLPHSEQVDISKRIGWN